MNKKIYIILIILLVVAGIFFFLNKESSHILDFEDCAYNINGQEITLISGYSEISEGLSKVITRYYGNETYGDVNNDELDDTAFIITQNSGGSGTFFYLVVALKNNDGYTGTNGIFLGDRVSIQNTEIKDGKIIVSYKDRKNSDTMVSSPSIEITKQFKLENGQIIDATPEEDIKEQGCLISGGTVKTSLCCGSASNFPNLCLIGACGCSPASSHEVKTCNCGKGSCFNGIECINN
jgi:hypothetical protein